MFDKRSRNPAAVTPIQISAVEFFRIELAPLTDGRIRVSLTATTVDEEEPELLDREVASDHVTSMDDVLALIRAHVRVSQDVPGPLPVAPS